MTLASPLLQMFMMSEAQKDASNLRMPVSSTGVGAQSGSQRKSIGNSKLSKREKLALLIRNRENKKKKIKVVKRGNGLGDAVPLPEEELHKV